MARSVRKIGLAVDAVAGVTLLAGILVLAAGVASVRDRHRYQAVVLKAIGATRPLLTRAFLLEYGALGLASALTGIATGALASWLPGHAADAPGVGVRATAVAAVAGAAVALRSRPGRWACGDARRAGARRRCVGVSASQTARHPAAGSRA